MGNMRYEGAYSFKPILFSKASFFRNVHSFSPLFRKSFCSKRAKKSGLRDFCNFGLAFYGVLNQIRNYFPCSIHSVKRVLSQDPQILGIHISLNFGILLLETFYFQNSEGLEEEKIMPSVRVQI